MSQRPRICNVFEIHKKNSNCSRTNFLNIKGQDNYCNRIFFFTFLCSERILCLRLCSTLSGSYSSLDPLCYDCQLICSVTVRQISINIDVILKCNQFYVYSQPVHVSFSPPLPGLATPGYFVAEKMKNKLIVLRERYTRYIY